MKKLEVEISDTLHDRLYRIVPDPAFSGETEEQQAIEPLKGQLKLL